MSFNDSFLLRIIIIDEHREVDHPHRIKRQIHQRFRHLQQNGTPAMIKDVFLELSVGKCTARTETAQGNDQVIKKWEKSQFGRIQFNSTISIRVISLSKPTIKTPQTTSIWEWVSYK